MKQEIVDEHIVQKTMSQWRKRKKPPNLKELGKRIDEYFNFCDENSIQPGLEGLAQCIGVVNKTVVRWSQGLYCTPEWAAVVSAARQTIGEVKDHEKNMYTRGWEDGRKLMYEEIRTMFEKS